MKRLIYARLSRTALSRLLRRAAAQRRSPQDEAGIILEEFFTMRPPDDHDIATRKAQDQGCKSSPDRSKP